MATRSTTTSRPSRIWVAFNLFVLPLYVVWAFQLNERGSFWSLFWAGLGVVAAHEIVEWVEWLVREGRSS